MPQNCGGISHRDTEFSYLFFSASLCLCGKIIIMRTRRLHELINDVKQSLSRFTEDDGPLHQKLIEVEDEMEDTVERIDQKIDQAAYNLDESMDHVGVVLEQAGREFDEHLEDVERELAVKTERFEHAIEEVLGEE